MAKTEKVYSRVDEAEDMIKKICQKHPDVLWCVRPENVAVYGVENKERPESCRIVAKIKSVKGVEKAVMQDNNIPIRYIINIYWSDWNSWKETKKQWILFHELLHIHHEIGKTVKHDCEDFRIILDKIGVYGYDADNLPDLVNGDVKFNLDLRPNLEDSDEETDNIDDDEDNKKIKKAKKERDIAKKAKAEEAKSEEVEEAKPEEVNNDDDKDIF